MVSPNNAPSYIQDLLEECEKGHITLRSEGLRGQPCPVCKRLRDNNNGQRREEQR